MNNRRKAEEEEKEEEEEEEEGDTIDITKITATNINHAERRWTVDQDEKNHRFIIPDVRKSCLGNQNGCENASTSTSTSTSLLLLQSWLKLSLTLDGRDKLTKYFQYLAKLMVYLLKDTSISTSNRFQALSLSLGTSRKAFRLGRSLHELEKLHRMNNLWTSLLLFLGIRRGITSTRNSNNADSGCCPPLPLPLDIATSPVKVTTTSALLMAAKTCAIMVYFWADNWNFLLASGFLDDHHTDETFRYSQRRKSRRSKASRLANRSYFLACIIGFYFNTKDCYHYFSNNKTASTSAMTESEEGNNTSATTEEEAPSMKNKPALLLSLLKNACDLLVFGNSSGVDLFEYWFGGKLNEVFHCLAGMTSSAAVLYDKLPS